VVVASDMLMVDLLVEEKNRRRKDMVWKDRKAKGEEARRGGPVIVIGSPGAIAIVMGGLASKRGDRTAWWRDGVMALEYGGVIYYNSKSWASGWKLLSVLGAMELVAAIATTTSLCGYCSTSETDSIHSRITGIKSSFHFLWMKISHWSTSRLLSCAPQDRGRPCGAASKHSMPSPLNSSALHLMLWNLCVAGQFQIAVITFLKHKHPFRFHE
jgi:hypothetical protein